MNETLKAAGNLGAELGAAMAENARLRGLLRDAAITLDGWRNTDELDELAEKITAALSRQAEPVHDLYRTSDEDAPESIKDRNGEVVLDLCRKCGRGEVELKDGCKAEPAPAQDEREAFNRALHSQKVFKLSSATIDAAEWAWFARPAQTEQQTIMQGLRIVFDGPPDHDAGRFVEVENEAGQSVDAGIWQERRDGLWELVLYNTPIAQTEQPEQSGLVAKLERVKLTDEEAWHHSVSAAIYWNNAVTACIAALSVQGSSKP